MKIGHFPTRKVANHPNNLFCCVRHIWTPPLALPARGFFMHTQRCFLCFCARPRSFTTTTTAPVILARSHDHSEAGSRLYALYGGHSGSLGGLSNLPRDQQRPAHAPITDQVTMRADQLPTTEHFRSHLVKEWPPAQPFVIELYPSLCDGIRPDHMAGCRA